MQAHVQRITAMYDVNACMSVGWTWPLNKTRYISLFIYFILNTLVSRLFCTCHSMCCCLLKNNRNVSMWHAAWASLLTTKEANSSQHCTKGTATASCYVNGNKLWHCSCCLGFSSWPPGLYRQHRTLRHYVTQLMMHSGPGNNLYIRGSAEKLKTKYCNPHCASITRAN